MKKKLLLGVLLMGVSAFGEMEVERGYGNFEISTDYRYTSSNVKGLDVISEMHNYEKAQNDFLFREIKTINLDKNEIIRPYFMGESRKNYNNAGGGVLILHSHQEHKYIGLQVDVKKVNFKQSSEEKISSNRGMVRVLYAEIGEDNEKKLLVSPYYIFDNLKDVRNRAVGIYARQEFDLNLAKYNLIENGLTGYVEADAHRNKIKKEKNSKIDNKNDSITLGAGVIYNPFEHHQFLENADVKTNFILGYNRELLEKRKYKSYNEKESNVDILKVGVSLDINYKNVTLNIEDTYEKSLNSRNYENRVSGKITYKF